MSGLKPFRHDGEEFAEIVHMGHAKGPQAVDIKMDNFTPDEARKFALWLFRAADEVEKFNKKRKPTKGEEG
jgi:hypothetical protein